MPFCLSLLSTSGGSFDSLLAQVTDKVAPIKEELKTWAENDLPRKLGLRTVVDGTPGAGAGAASAGTTGGGVAGGAEGVQGNPTTCKLCELLVVWAENQLAKNKTRQEIIAHLDKVGAPTSWRLTSA